MKKRIFLSVISILLLISMIFSMVACFGKIAKEKADEIIDKIDPSVKPGTEGNNPSWGGDSNNPEGNPNVDNNIVKKTDLFPDPEANPNGTILYEEVLIEDVLKENILTEEVLYESFLHEINLAEKEIGEEIIVESYSSDIITSVDDLEDAFLCDTGVNYTDIDFDLLRSRLAMGLDMVWTEATIDLGSAVFDIVCGSVGAMCVDLGQFVITAGVTPLSALIAYNKSLKLQLDAGVRYEDARIEASIKGINTFFYAAVGCEIFNTVISVGQASINTVKSIKDIKVAVNSLGAGAQVANTLGTTVKTVDNGALEVTVKESGKQTKHLCNAGSNSLDYYDDTGKYVGTLVKKGSQLTLQKNEIPNEIFTDNGVLKYTVDNNSNIYRVTTNANGGYTQRRMGRIDRGGYVKNGFGQIIDKIDLTTGKSYGGFSGISRVSKNISVNEVGDLIDLKTMKPLKLKNLKGIDTFVDSNNNAIVYKYIGKDGKTYLKRVDNGRTVGELVEKGKFNPYWKAELNSRRNYATREASRDIIKYVNQTINGTQRSFTEIRAKFPQLSVADIKVIRNTGNLPRGKFQIHHCNNVANYPDQADDLSNLVLVTVKQHKDLHGGNYANPTNSRPDYYTDLNVIKREVDKAA